MSRATDSPSQNPSETPPLESPSSGLDPARSRAASATSSASSTISKDEATALHLDVPAREARPSDISALLRLQGEPGKLDRIAEQIRPLAQGSSLSQVLQLGELIFREVYESRPALLHKGARQASLRRLAAHPDVPCQVTTLWRAVSVYEMSLRLPQVFDLKDIGVSHLRAVIGLPGHVQEHLLITAAQERWPKRRLEREATLHRQGKRRGRQPLPKLLRWARELERLVERSKSLGPEDFTLRSAAALEARNALARCCQRCEQIAAEIEAPPSSRPRS